MALASRRYHSWDDASSPRNQRGMPDYSDPQEQQVLPTRPSKYLVVPIHVFKNGDPFYTGKKFVANTKSAPTFNHLLEQLTDLIKPITGMILYLYTNI